MSLNLSTRRAPYRKKKSVSPKEVDDYVEQQNIIGYPSDISNIDVSCARTYCAAITADRNVVVWGKFAPELRLTRIPREANSVIQLATADEYMVALKGDGTLVGWGVRDSLKPPSNLNNVSKVVAGKDNFLALLDNGTLVGWGSKLNFDVTKLPAKIYEDGSPIVDISMGYYHAVALKENGKVFIWGDEGKVKFPKLKSKIISIKSFGIFNLALQQNGKLISWGSDMFGQDLIPSSLDDEIVVSYSVGLCHCGAITESGKTIVWGWDPKDQNLSESFVEYDRRGDPDEFEIPVDVKEKQYFIEVPEDFINAPDDKVIKIYCGYDVNFTLMKSGDLVGWGDKVYNLLDIPEITPPLQRLDQPKIDLKKFGINLDIDDVLLERFSVNPSIVKSIVRDDGNVWQTEKNTYKKGKFLGAGTYGKAYIATNQDGEEAAVKIISMFEEDDPSKTLRKDNLKSALLEVTVQLIIQEEAKRNELGYRACGNIYEVAIDSRNNLFYIFQEKLDMGLDKALKIDGLRKAEYADMFIQIGEKLNWLYDNFEYNHRDFKDDNLMVKIHSDGSKEVLFIDFGMSCMTYRGIRVKVRSYFQDEKCFRETRDITFLLYTVLKHTASILPSDIANTIRRMLIFKIKGKTCDVFSKNCGFEKSKTEQNWQFDLYDILDLDYVFNPNATTDALIKYMSPFLKTEY
jgi:alpha-tubulin suppressor-like RCC1 family protein